MSEQRRAARLGLSGMRGEVQVLQPLAVTEMSRRGMQVETSSPLQVDSLHEFRLSLADFVTIVKGRVAHSRINHVDRDVVTYLSGIEFVELSERVAAAIEEFLQTVSRDREAVRRDSGG